MDCLELLMLAPGELGHVDPVLWCDPPCLCAACLLDLKNTSKIKIGRLLAKKKAVRAKIAELDGEISALDEECSDISRKIDRLRSTLAPTVLP